MDNWFRFQYLTVSELLGHMEEERAGKEKTGASVGGVRQEKPTGNPRTRCGAKKSSEVLRVRGEKSRYCVQ